MLNIYKASAGSGKTYTLAQEYIKLLLGYYNHEKKQWEMRSRPEKAHRHILAITFTNKSTQEMTSRIIKELAILGRCEPGVHKDSDYLPYFTKLFRRTPDEVCALANEVLFDVLFDFGSFHVSTIDAFFQTVLRTFAREIEMPDNFEIELDNSYAISLGVNEMFNSINYRRPVDPIKKKEFEWLNKWLTRYMQTQLENGRKVNLFSRHSSIFSSLVEMFSKLIDEDFKTQKDLIIPYLDDLKRIPAFEKALKAVADESVEHLAAEANRLLAYEHTKHLNHYVQLYIEKLSRKESTKASATVINAATDDHKRFKGKYLGSKEFDPDFSDAVGRLLAEALEAENRNRTIATCLKSLTAMGLLGCLLHYIQEYCKDNNLILLSETNTLLNDIINDDDTPFVYERLGYYLKNFLIDEFQDTSHMQWDNLRPLIVESLSHSHENLIIGDEKQCIYRFRNSDPELLGHVVADQVALTYNPDIINVRGTRITENNNWRSAIEVVRFNNSLFHTIAGVTDSENGIDSSDPLSARFAYSGLVQQIPAKNSDFHGSVRLYITPEADDNDTIPEEEDADGDKPKQSAKTLRYILDTTVAEIERLLAIGYRPKDIAILVRTHSEGSAVINRIMDAFRDPEWKYGEIEINSADSLSVSASPAVGLIISLLRLYLTPEYIEVTTTDSAGHPSVTQTENPEYKRARLLQCYEFLLHKATPDANGAISTADRTEALLRALAMLDQPENLSDEQRLQRDIDQTNYSERANSDEQELKCPTLTLIVERLMKQFLEPVALQRESIYLTAFKDIITDFCNRGSSDIRAFLRWWDRGGSRTPVGGSDDSNSISVMTIHASKGLEFPAVIIPFANWDIVNYHTPTRTCYHWFTLDNSYLPDIEPELVPKLIPLEFSAALANTPAFETEARRTASKQSVDNLNVAYVAFTRAKSSLTAIIPALSQCKSSKNIASLIHKSIALSTPEFIAGDPTLPDDARQWVEPLADKLDGTTLSYGTLLPPPADDKADKKERETDVQNDSKTRITPIEAPPYRPVVNQRLLTVSKLDTEHFDFDNPRHRGNFLHSVMSRLRHPDRLDTVLRRAIYRSHLDDRQAQWCRQILGRALADPRVQHWFTGYRKIKTECTIINRSKPRRPDRIVWTADGHIDIVDYKFGDQHDTYATQLTRYMMLMRTAGYSNVRGYLWYPIEGRIVQVIYADKTIELA